MATPILHTMERNRRVVYITLSSILLVLYLVWFMYPHLPVRKKKKYAVLTDLSTREDKLLQANLVPAVFNPSSSSNLDLLRIVGSAKCSSKPVPSTWNNLDHFTILVTVRNTNERLLSTLEHYCVMDGVDQVLVVWSGRRELIPNGAVDLNCPVCVTYLKQPEELATNRFKPFLQIRTQGG